ncbi:unnamed protein product [Clonostachys rosea]|uniref:Xylanolytic transcriptional activator regulatory domain-containing protein n=1 Tax=Bionectria ochroleuca TaxID=29856 RepID=A0ABY6UKV3_BIOOC|nr:unnamed protein product [Clonostachys rosea]
MERPRKRKLDPDYVAGLEDQINMLKEEIRRLKDHPSGTLSIDAASELQAASEEKDAIHLISVQSQVLSHTEIEPLNSSKAIDDISSMMWQMTVKDNGETSFYGPSGNFCFLEIQQASTAPAEKESSGEEALSRRWIPHDPAIAMKLLNLFTEYINPIHQFVERDALSRLRKDSSPSMELLEYAILAAGALFSDDASLRAYGREMAAHAESISLNVCRSNASIEAVQALAILSWRELSQENDNMGFMFNGMKIFTLQLFLYVLLTGIMTSPSPGPMNSALQNRRIKAAWALLFTDRVATSLLGRNSVGESPSEEEIVFDAHSQLWFIHDQYMDQIYSFEFDGLEDSQRYQFLLEARRI